MTQFDKDYLDLCKKILKEGIEVENRTGTNTVKIPSYNFHFNLQEEFPILQSKQLYFKNAITEMLWIYQAASNDVSFLNERNNHIWDKWKIDSDGFYREYYENTDIIKSEKYYGIEYAGTIGSAYGYVVRLYNLMGRVLNLKDNPNDRRVVISLWQENCLDKGVLPPCVWSSEWDVTDGKLNLLVHQRSCDVALGLPFNVTQYATLLTLVANCLGYLPGTIDWSIKDAHIYVDCVDKIKEQISRYDTYLELKKKTKRELIELKRKLEDEQFEHSITEYNDLMLRCIDLLETKEKPYLWINKDIKDFYKYDNSRELKDIKVKQYRHLGKLKFPDAH